MSLYRYSALDSSNAIKKGVVEDIDKASAARRLMGQGLRPLEIKEHQDEIKSAINFDFLKRKKLNKTDIEFFTTQIALLLNAGLSLDASLRTLKLNSQIPSF